MESQESENTSIIVPEVRREVFDDLKSNLIEIMDKLPGVSGRFILSQSKDSEHVEQKVSTKTSNYSFLRNVNANDTEITINRSGKLANNHPSIVLESIRFKYGTHSLKPVDPLLEYHKTVKDGNSVTLQNTIGTLKMIEQFIKDLEMEAKR
jgi:hypothetical protein